MKKGAFPAPAASRSWVPAASRRVPPPALLSAPATRSFFVQHIPAEINEEKIVGLIGARAGGRRAGGAAAGSPPGAAGAQRGVGGGRVPRGCAHLTASCPRCPGGLAPPPRSAGHGPARGGARYAAPPRSHRGSELPPQIFGELGCLEATPLASRLGGRKGGRGGSAGAPRRSYRRGSEEERQGSRLG